MGWGETEKITSADYGMFGYYEWYSNSTFIPSTLFDRKIFRHVIFTVKGYIIKILLTNFFEGFFCKCSDVLELPP